MSTFGGMWSLCGGWAVDGWLGRRTRDHKDVDIAVFQDDLNVLLDHLAGWQLIAHDVIDPDSSEQWHGRRVYLPAHLHARYQGAELDFQVNERSGNDWVLTLEPRMVLPVSQCVLRSGWRLPTAAPEVILFYKATAYFGVEGLWKRPHDDADFLALLPMLSAERRAWLRKAITLLQPEHPWLAQLSP
jgi:hypothetical protein